MSRIPDVPPPESAPSRLIAMSKNAGKPTADMAKACVDDGFQVLPCDSVPPDELWFVQPRERHFSRHDTGLTYRIEFEIVGKITGIGR